MQISKLMKNIITILLLLVCLNANATDYYVSNAGNDAANGLTTGTAWQTISKVNSTSFSPGDNIYFQRGGIWSEQLNFPSSGSYGIPITISAYGAGVRPIIDGGLIRQYGIYVSKKSNLVISDINVINCLYAGIRLDGCGMYNGNPNTYFQGNSIIERVSASNCVIFGIVTGNGYSNATIRNSVAFSNGNGFYSDGQANYTLFQYDTSWGNKRRLTTPLTDGDGFGVYKSSFNTIENSLSYENKTGFGIEVDLADTDSAIIIRYNKCYLNGSQLEGYGIATGNLIGATNLVYYNLCYLNGNDPVDQMGREIQHHDGNISFTNNTLYTTGTALAYGFTLFDAGSVTLNNNIVFSVGGNNRRCVRRLNTIVLTSDNNQFYSTATTPFLDGVTGYSFTGWKALGRDTMSLFSDPIIGLALKIISLEDTITALQLRVDNLKAISTTTTIIE